MIQSRQQKWLRNSGVARNSQLGEGLAAPGGLRSKPPALGDFCNFSTKITHFMHISAKIIILKQ